MNQKKSMLTATLGITILVLIAAGAYGWGGGTASQSQSPTIKNAQAPGFDVTTFATTSFTTTAQPGYGGSGGGGGSAIVITQTATSGRVQAIAQGITGTVDNGRFELVSGQVLIIASSLGGFVQTSELTLTNGLWYGTWVVNIPSNESQQSLFNYTSLVNSYGNVVSVDVKTSDVTAATHGNASAVPYAPISIQLQEVSAKGPTPTGLQATLNQLESVLFMIGSGVLYYGALAIPVFGLSLVLIYAGRRVFYPLLMRAYKEKRRVD